MFGSRLGASLALFSSALCTPPVRTLQCALSSRINIERSGNDAKDTMPEAGSIAVTRSRQCLRRRALPLLLRRGILCNDLRHLAEHCEHDFVVSTQLCLSDAESLLLCLHAHNRLRIYR